MDQLGRKTVEEFKAAVKIPVIAVLDNVRSMHNVGSVFRTADSFLLEAIYLCGYTPRPPHREIQKTALGATETVDWHYFTTTQQAIQQLQQNGYAIVSVEQAAGSVPLQQFSWDGTTKLALIFGNEVEGVQQEIVSNSTTCIEIPQTGTKHSLNISVAAGIVLWELVRRVIV